MRAALLIGVLLAAAASAADPPPRRLYRLSTETGMPHLEWNLRHAVVAETRCLSRAELATSFWMLRDVSLQDCSLVGIDAARWRLQCSGGHGTSGEARWDWGEPPGAVSRGQLDVRLGGKNMTFWQRIEARPLGDCD